MDPDPTLLQLTQEAALRAYNRKRVFRQFLRRCGVPDNLLSTCSEGETKRDWLDRIFPALEHLQSGLTVISTIASELVKHESFPDLENYEDSIQRVRDARSAIKALSEYLERRRKAGQEEKDKSERRSRAEARRTEVVKTKNSLISLRLRLDTLATSIGTQQAGYEFQDWFYDLADFFEIDNRRPYNSGGRQIDGTLSVDGTTYLVELKFTQEQVGGPDIDGLLSKVGSKADNTMGIFVSMAGFNGGAIQTSSFSRTPLLLVDFNHLYHSLSGAMTFNEIIQRVRRHASQTGEAFLAVANFGG
jgi:hypothetical protein